MTIVADTVPETPSEPVLADPESFQALPVVTIAAAHGVHDTYTAFLPTLLPMIIERLALSDTRAGLLQVFLSWPSILQPFIGFLADRVSLRYLVIFAPAVTATAMSLLGIAPSYAVMAMLLIVAGVSAAGLHAVGPVVTGNVSGRKLGRGLGWWMVGGGLGYTVGPLLIVAVVETWTLPRTPWLMLGGILASLVLYLRLRNAATDPHRFTRARSWREALRAIRPFLLPLVGITIARSFLTSAMNTFLPTFLSREGSSLWYAGAALSVYEAAGMIGALTIGALSDRLGRRRLLAISMALLSPLAGLFLMARGPAQFPILLCVGFSALAVNPVMMALLQESVPESRALATGFYMGISFLAQAGATVILGILGDQFGLRFAFTVSAALPLLGVPLILLLPAGRRRYTM